MAVDIGVRTERARDESPYDIILSKHQERPAGVEEITGTRERAAGTDHQQTRLFKVPWSQRHVFREWVHGYSRGVVIEGITAQDLKDATTNNLDLSLSEDSALFPAVTQIVRVIPAQDPERPWLFAANSELIDTQGAWVEDPGYLEPGGGLPSLSTIAYVNNSRGGSARNVLDVGAEPAIPRRFSDGYGTWRVVYTPRQYRVMTDEELRKTDRWGTELRRYVTRNEEFSLEALPLAKLINGGSLQLRFTGGPFQGQIVPEAGVKQLATATLTYTWHDVPDRPWGAYRRCLGRVNADTFDGFRGSPKYPAGSLLCLPWRTKETTSVVGRVTWEITFRFGYRPQGWNYLPAADGLFYYATWRDGAPVDPNSPGQPIYRDADFDTLFQAPPPFDYS